QEITRKNAEFAQQQATFYQQLDKDTQQKSLGYIAQNMALVYGNPSLSPMEQNGQPKYDPERSLMFAQLQYANLQDRQEITFVVPPGQKAEYFYSQLQAGKLLPKVVYRHEDRGGKVRFDRLEVRQSQQTYLAQLDTNANFIAQKPLEVVLQETSAMPQLAQNQVNAVVFDQNALANLQLQNPNIKDVQFEAYVLQEHKNFNDDIPQLLATAKAAPIDRKKWLFVVGIGKYEKTDDILYSRRSAEWFAKVASKTLGIQKGRQVVLLDQKASSGAIKDELKLMLSKVKKGDEIIFYYSGHGIPVAEKDNQPFILPADKIPDFVADDDFFQAQKIYRELANSNASSVVAFMDSCFTGQTDGKSLFAGAKAATRLTPKQFKPNPNGNLAILTAGNEKQFSNAYGEKGHRLFSYYVMKGLLKGYEQVGDLAVKVQGDVTDTSLDLGGLNRQTPVFSGNGKLKL
ncbi:MAG: caspase family protein, partial [Moraxella osloensis]|nr:caspase family protein [Moraxella osloensis]